MATGYSKVRHILRTESKLIWDSILQFTLFSSFGYHSSANSEAAMGILTHCWSVLMSHRKRLSGVCMDLKFLAFCPFSSLTVKTCAFMLPYCVTPRCFQVSLVPQFESCVSGLLKEWFMCCVRLHMFSELMWSYRICSEGFHISVL